MSKLSTTALLRRLESTARSYGPGSGEAKAVLVRALARRQLGTAAQVLKLHEALCLLRAYPDDAQLLAAVDEALRAFADRSDLGRHRCELSDTGVAGTPIHYRFFWPIASWLAERWPDHLRLVWDDDEASAHIGQALRQLVPPALRESLIHDGWSGREAIERIRGSATDAVFVISRIAAMPGDDLTREALHDGIDAEYVIEPAAGTPNRTLARAEAAPRAFRAEPPSRERPDLRLAIGRPPRRVRIVSRAEGRRLIDLACEAMVTRSRDLEAFGFGDDRDVRLVDDGDGLAFACIGVRPERRGLLHAIHGLLTLRNGVPIGYAQADVLFRTAAISYNTFETFRGGEAAHVFGRFLATVSHLFDVESFSIEPYQLGHGNSEGLDSGAWWFYYKLGFRPHAPRVLRVLRRELAAMKRDPRHRSPRRSLEQLAVAHVFFHRKRNGAFLPPPPWSVGLAVSHVLARYGNADARSAQRALDREAVRLLELGSLRGWSAGQREALRRWSPLLLALPGVQRWSAEQRRDLARIVRAKGGRSETDFVTASNGHRNLRRALLRLQARERQT